MTWARRTNRSPADAEIYRRCLPISFDAFRSHSDGNLFFEAGVKPLILGPGALEVAHTPDEHTPFAQVLAAAKIYARALCLRADSCRGKACLALGDACVAPTTGRAPSVRPYSISTRE
jgi:hypothetical protein